ncbi:hypothetical protein LIER_39981 [Lithospermum erythrorhizon]|uniref:Embryo defective n=1 Tax=Lithospermum erythrorhizon TaxID=34254 RepID=A0AAV3QPE6_LITER
MSSSTFPALSFSNPFLNYKLRSSLCSSAQIQTKNIKSNFNFKVISKNKRNFGFVLKAHTENGDMGIKIQEKEEQVLSSMPDRFRPLTKEAPDKPLRWPYFIALGLLLYAWRMVLWELSNWRKVSLAIFQLFGYISKLVLASIFLYIGDPVTSLIRGVETTLYAFRASYSWLIAYAPLKELTIMIMLASIVLSVAEATVPDSVNNNQFLLSVAGAIGFAAVAGYITELFFWTLLLGLFGFSRLVKKRDYVSSALPVVLVLAAVGEPWLRMLAMSSFLVLAIFQYSKKPLGEKEDKATGIVKKIPVPLLCAAFSMGIHLAAKWAGYRHLTWMVA